VRRVHVRAPRARGGLVGTLLVALALCSAFSSPLQAQLREDGTTDRQLMQRDRDVATGDCQAATLIRLRATYAGGRAVLWDSTARALVSFNHMVTVRGTGLVQEPSLQGWRLFVYQCAFMYQTRQHIVRLQVDSARFVP
jgi:hypothetical protein